MNNTNKRIITAILIIVAGSIIYATSIYRSEWLYPVTSIFLALFIIVMVYRFLKTNWKERHDDPTNTLNYIIPDKFRKYGIVIWIILVLSTFFLFKFCREYKFFDITFLQKIEKETIIKKFNAAGQLIEQKSYKECPSDTPFLHMLLLSIIGIVFLVSTIRQEKVDDERVKMIRLKAFREVFIVSMVLGIIIFIYSFYYYAPPDIWYWYIFFNFLYYQSRSRSWSNKI